METDILKVTIICFVSATFILAFFIADLRHRIKELRKAGDWAVWLLERDEIRKLSGELNWGDPFAVTEMFRKLGCEDPNKRNQPPWK